MTIINLHIIWLTEKNSLLHGVWQYWGRTMLSSSSATWQQLFGQDYYGSTKSFFCYFFIVY